MILVTAATPWEAKPLARRWRLSPAAGSAGLEHAGKVAGHEVRLIQTGMGRERTRTALDAVEARGWPAPSLVVSAGFAGALQEADVKEKWKQDAYDFSPNSPGKFGQFVRSEYARYGALIKKLGVNRQ